MRGRFRSRRRWRRRVGQRLPDSGSLADRAGRPPPESAATALDLLGELGRGQASAKAGGRTPGKVLLWDALLTRPCRLDPPVPLPVFPDPPRPGAEDVPPLYRQTAAFLSWDPAEPAAPPTYVTGPGGGAAETRFR